jgi:TolB-like protein
LPFQKKELPVLLTFGDCEIDTHLFALRRQGLACQIEPMVFNLLLYLLQHHDRVVTRQELLDAIWPRKVVSESTLSSCIKVARHAIGDDGETQAFIATLQRRGYRFVAEVSEHAESAAGVTGLAAVSVAPSVPVRDPSTLARRASIAVMPFIDLAPDAKVPGSMAGALTHDLITRLAQLRSLFVIAQGTVFELGERNVGPRDAGRLLNVDYFVSGTLQRNTRELVVSVELVETISSRIVWAETLRSRKKDVLQILDEIGNLIVSQVDSEVETSERHHAILKQPESLDAWEAHHRGLWHMYRFNREDNIKAQCFFDIAVRLDPTFSRAWAGLSFTHFQHAFQGWMPRESASERAFESASHSLLADARSPAAHWAMGRALWLRNRHDQAVLELGQAVELSPSFALGHYSLAFIHSQAGDALAAIAASDHSRLLSPYDPLMFGMLGARAMALVRLGRFKEAADYAVKAATLPNAHVHIHCISAYSLALADSLPEARAQFAAIRQVHPGYDIDDFLAAFNFDAKGVALFRQGAMHLGID